MWIFTAITVIAYIGGSLAFCYTTKPKVSEYEFPFSITYEYKGKTGTLACMLFGIVESSVELINQITYNIPPMALLCLALSVVFRRKGYSKTGFFIQFAGILMFVLVFALGSL